LYFRALYGIEKISADIPNGQHFVLAKRAKAAREKRAASPQEDAITAAIEAEQAASPTLRPYKEALAMLHAVNHQLETAGFAPVKVDVVRRRLEKRAALLKSAEKAPR
jgi:hypothetical protein